MPISEKTEALVIRRWRAFCKAVNQAEAEHGASLSCYFGASQVVCDFDRLEAHHACSEGSGRGPALSKASGLTVYGGTNYEDGGAIVLSLPCVKGFHQDGGDW